MTQQSSAAVRAERKPLRLTGQNGQRPRLLLAEDCDPVRIVTAAMLKGMGCDVDAVIHGEQAVKSASEQRFDVIVLDIEMPIMDGITAARSIRRMGGIASGTPLMALSAFLADSVRNGQWRDTFDIALPKPANRNELHDALKTALLWPLPGGQAQPEPVLPPIIDQQQFHDLRCGITANIWEELASLACRDIGTCISQLERLASGRHDGAVLTFAGKLHALGRTFAAPRLSLMAENVQLAPSEEARMLAVESLMAAARATLAALEA